MNLTKVLFIFILPTSAFFIGFFINEILWNGGMGFQSNSSYYAYNSARAASLPPSAWNVTDNIAGIVIPLSPTVGQQTEKTKIERQSCKGQLTPNWNVVTSRPLRKHAVLISGQFRCAKCFVRLLDAFDSSFGVDYYVAVNGISDSELKHLIIDSRVVAYIIIPGQPLINESTTSHDFPFDLCMLVPNFPFRPSSSHEPWGVQVRANTAWQYWGNYIVWIMALSLANRSHHKYEILVRARPDLIFPMENLDLNTYANLSIENLTSTNLVSKVLVTTFTPYEIDSAVDYPPSGSLKYVQTIPINHVLFVGPGGMEPDGISDQFYFGFQGIMGALMSAILHMDPLFAHEGYRYRYNHYFSSEQLLRASVARHFRFLTAREARQHKLFLAVPTGAKWCYRGCNPDIYAAAVRLNFTPRYPENQ
jgi:hypothetical protein